MVVACIPAEDRPSEASAVRLSDVYTADMLADPAEVVETERSEWRLAALGADGSGEPAGWSFRAPVGIDRATVGDGGLAGTVAMPRPVVVLEAPSPLGDGDRLHAIEVRMKVSDGRSLQVTALGAPGPGMPPAEAFAAPDGPPFALSTPLLPGDETATYRIELANTMILGPLARSAPTRVVLRPSDVPGATFELDSVRLVFHREHLAGVPSGLGWHGLGEVWRETLVSRPGERLVLPVTVPRERPVLDLALGSPTDEPIGFRIGLRPAGVGGDEGGEGGDLRTILRRTVTRADRWEQDRVDLAPWAGRGVELVLEIESEAAGAVGLWGSPAVRGRREPRAVRTASAASAASAGSRRTRPQGVILVIVDTLRRDHLDAWGYERQTAPVLSGLAGDGVRFADAIAQCTWTKVSVPSILSSLYPTAHGVVDLSDRLPAAADTLAESFRQAGYATMATSAWPFTGQMTNLHQGVELLYEGGSVELPPGASRTKTTRWFTDRVLEFVEHHRDEPFFVTLHTGDPHSPYRPFDRYAGLWSEPGADAWHAETLERARPHIEDPFFRNFELPTADDLDRAGIPLDEWRDHEVAWYDGSIRGVDTEIGRLLDRLEHLGLTDDVVVAVVADHGEEFFEQGMNWHGTNLYGPQTDVPFILWGPGFLPAGVTVDEPVGLIDVAPTLLSLARLPIPASAQGRDLLPLVAATAAGEAPSARGFRVEPVFAERTTEGIERGFPRGALPTSWAVVTSDWRLIRNPGAPEGAPEVELYDRRTDPLSLTDVAAEHPEVVERLAQTLAGWRAWVDDHKLEADASGQVSAEELERLRSLGYL
jgi:arylsulfatase A-like enzyme